MKTEKEVLKKLEEQQEKLKAKIQAVKAKAAKKERKEETRKKVLLGAYLINQMEVGKIDKGEVMKGLDKFLTRPQDREIFGLPVPEKSAAVPEKSAGKVKSDKAG